MLLLRDIGCAAIAATDDGSAGSAATATAAASSFNLLISAGCLHKCASVRHAAIQI